MKFPALAAIIVVFGFGGLEAQVVSLNPVADAFVSSVNPTGNFGSGGGFSIAAAGLPKGEFDTLLRFDFAAAKANFDAAYGVGLWTISTMSLRLTANPPNSTIFNGNGAGPSATNVNFAGQFAVTWMANDTWIEGTGTPTAPGTTGITFATLPAFLGASDEALGAFAFDGSTTATSNYALALAPFFTADSAAGSSVSLLLRADDTALSYTAASRTNAASASRPSLTVTASPVPEPSATVLALAGISMLAGRRRSRSEAARQTGQTAWLKPKSSSECVSR